MEESYSNKNNKFQDSYKFYEENGSDQNESKVDLKQNFNDSFNDNSSVTSEVSRSEIINFCKDKLANLLALHETEKDIIFRAYTLFQKFITNSLPKICETEIYSKSLLNKLISRLTRESRFCLLKEAYYKYTTTLNNYSSEESESSQEQYLDFDFQL